jgi:hypothetical protein
MYNRVIAPVITQSRHVLRLEEEEEVAEVVVVTLERMIVWKILLARVVVE